MAKHIADPVVRRPARILNTILGLIGEICITLGIILGLFVVWELWWTDIEAGKKQEVILQQVETKFSPIVNKLGQVHNANEPLPEEEFSTKKGDVLATLRVPTWGDKYRIAIMEGVSEYGVLDTGSAGHYPDTAFPGQVGNFAIAAHRQTHGRPFWNIDQLKVGDTLIVETPKTWQVYKIDKFYITKPQDSNAISPVPGQDPKVEPTERYITLTTCHPLYSMAERWIVNAKLSHWTLRSDGVPPELKNSKGVQ